MVRAMFGACERWCFMKVYIVYTDGNERGYIRAGSHNAAEKKAQKIYPDRQVSVEYTEVSSWASVPETRRL